MKSIIAISAYILTIPTANWMIGSFGYCDPYPCTIPVGFGLFAPSGVLMIGLAFSLRDYVQEQIGLWGAAWAIAGGAALSMIVAPPALAVASVLAFALSEGLDLAVYTPLRRLSKPLGVLASGVVGSIVDSAVFLFVAFGSLLFIQGQIVGKIEMTIFAAAAVYIVGLLTRNDR